MAISKTSTNSTYWPAFQNVTEKKEQRERERTWGDEKMRIKKSTCSPGLNSFYTLLLFAYFAYVPCFTSAIISVLAAAVSRFILNCYKYSTTLLPMFIETGIFPTQEDFNMANGPWLFFLP